MEKLKNIPIKIAVRAILVDNERKAILIKRATGTFEEGKWCLVGGKIDANESPEEAVLRETKKEAGITFTSSYYAEIENPDTSSGQKWITHYFIGTVNALPKNLNVTEATEIGFFSQAEIEKLDIAFDHKEVLVKYFKETSG